MRISDWGSDVCSSDLGPTASIGWKPIWTRRKGRTMEKLFETWSLEREIVLVKVLKNTRHKVFAAWMDQDALAQWYGLTEIGRASRRERVGQTVTLKVSAVTIKKKTI